MCLVLDASVAPRVEQAASGALVLEHLVDLGRDERRLALLRAKGRERRIGLGLDEVMLRDDLQNVLGHVGNLGSRTRARSLAGGP
jgi:hypothetical protein